MKKHPDLDYRRDQDSGRLHINILGQRFLTHRRVRYPSEDSTEDSTEDSHLYRSCLLTEYWACLVHRRLKKDEAISNEEAERLFSFLNVFNSDECWEKRKAALIPSPVEKDMLLDEVSILEGLPNELKFTTIDLSADDAEDLASEFRKKVHKDYFPRLKDKSFQDKLSKSRKARKDAKAKLSKIDLEEVGKSVLSERLSEVQMAQKGNKALVLVQFSKCLGKHEWLPTTEQFNERLEKYVSLTDTSKSFGSYYRSRSEFRRDLRSLGLHMYT